MLLVAHEYNNINNNNTISTPGAVTMAPYEQPVFICRGGMGMLPKHLSQDVQAFNVKICQDVWINQVKQIRNGQWAFYGRGGRCMGEFDYMIVVYQTHLLTNGVAPTRVRHFDRALPGKDQGRRGAVAWPATR